MIYNNTLKRMLIRECDKVSDPVHKHTQQSINSISDASVKSSLQTANDISIDMAIAMHSCDKAGNYSFPAKGLSLQLSSNIDDIDTAIAEISGVNEELLRTLDKLRTSGKSSYISPLAELPIRTFKQTTDYLTGIVASLEKAKENSDGEIDGVYDLTLNAIHRGFIDKLPSRQLNILNKYFTGDEINDTITFEGGSILTSIDSMGFEVGSSGALAMPLAHVQNYYSMLTFLVQTPIVMRPTPWTDDLVQRIVTSSEMVRQSTLIKLIELSDEMVDFDEGPPAIDRAVNVLAKLKNGTTENSMSSELSSQTMRISTDEFKIPIQRINYERTVLITTHGFKLRMDQIIRDFILGAVGERATVIASGDPDATAAGPNKVPGILQLTGLDRDGAYNNTLNELDLRKILDSLNNHLSGTMMTHMLIHPKALLTICDTFREMGYWPKEISGGDRLLSQPLSTINPGQYTTGAGIGNPEMSQRAPGLFGPGATNMGSLFSPATGMDPGIGEVAYATINATSPGTSAFNSESAFYHKFVIKIGNVTLQVVPNIGAKLYRPNNNGHWTDVTTLADEIPTLAVQGDVYTDIILLNKERTATFITTGIMQKSLIDSSGYESTLNVALHEEYRLILNARVEIYQITKVKIDSDFSHRALVIRKGQ